MLAFAALVLPTAAVFRGFIVAQGDSRLFHRSHPVIIARNGDCRAVPMTNDGTAHVKDFALMVPSPAMPRRENIRTGDPAW
ncbi:DUF2330 domain-containing protein (plasmid) [Deinococcus taeanensis]|nr:DUF2330 domain-containing protein [Deinococcus taeanensis]